MREVLQRLYAGYARREVDPDRALFADGFRFNTRPGWPGPPFYSLDDMPKIWADLDETFTEYRLTPVREHDAPDGYAMVELTSSTRLPGGERITEPVVHLWGFAEGLIAEAWTFGTIAEARAFISERRNAA